MFKRLFLIGVVILMLLGLTLPTPAHAFDLDQGKKVFTANCLQCHARGNNIVVRSKTLKQDALAKYGMDSQEAIVQQVTNGKNAMPAFGRRLKPEEIENVAAYVLAQAEAGWSR